MFYNFIGFKTLLGKEVQRFMKVYLQTLFVPLLTNMLFLGVFGGVFKDRDIGIAGVGYLPFLVPGLCFMGASMSAYLNPSSSIIIQKYQGVMQDLNSYPINAFEKTMSYILGGALRGFLVGLCTYLATIYFVGYQISNPVLFFGMLFVISMIFSALGLICGLKLDTFDGISFIGNIVITPLVYFGGVFFQISTLPGFISNVAMFNPIFPLVDLMRYSYVNIHEGNMMINVSFTIFIFLFLNTVALMMVKKGVGLKD